jgi:hypothetical protein
MLKAAQQAEENFMTVTRVAPEAVGLSQAFPANAIGGGVYPAGATAGAFLSQAKTTLNPTPAAVDIPLMDHLPLLQVEGVGNESSLILDAAAHTHSWNLATAITLSSVWTRIIQAYTKMLRKILTG